MFRPKGTPSLEGRESGSVLPQFAAAIIASLAYMSAGCTLGWTSPILPALETNHYIVLSEEEESWVTGLVSMGAAVGPLFAGYVASWIGHKISIMITTGMFFVGWAAVAAARSAAVLYVARMILGIAVGFSFTIPPTYIGEITQVNLRGALGSMSQMFSTSGLLFAYVVGPWSSYVALALASCVIPAILLVGMFFIPDSPYQLLMRGKKEEARKAFLWLRGKSGSEKDDELEAIEEEVAKLMDQESSVKDLVANRATIKALVLSQGLAILQQLSGINAVLFFAQKIFSLSGSSLEPSIATIVIGTVMLLAAATTPFIVERAGRRILLMVSAAVMCVAQIVLGGFFYFLNAGDDTSAYGFVPTVSLVFYIIAFSIGFGPLTWAVSAELFAPIVRSKAASLTAFTCWMFAFLVTYFFQSLVNIFHSHVVFWAFSVCCAVGGVFVYFLLPETKGKTFREIQDLLEW